MTDLEIALEVLASQQGKPAARHLQAFSDLRRDEVALLRERWFQIAPKRRRAIAQWLLDLAEDCIDLEFLDAFKVCLDDPDREVRLAGIEGLWEEEGWELADRLLLVLAKDPDEGVRAAAASALSRYTYLVEIGKAEEHRGQALKEALIAVIENLAQPLEVRRRALEAVSFISGDPKIPQSIAEAYASPQQLLRVSALFAMGRQCDPTWLDILLHELRSDDPAIRFEAARACGEMEDSQAVEPLLTLVNDEDLEVRLAAIEALGRIGGPSAKEALGELAQNENEAVREAAEEALEEAIFADDVLSPPL
ncbi:MAG: HEAT repeat domain-containing protein [Chloroflexi bacterium]|nr:HEAT repeat domain-containing protein [Chloroflexota bacterium]